MHLHLQCPFPACKAGFNKAARKAGQDAAWNPAWTASTLLACRVFLVKPAVGYNLETMADGTASTTKANTNTGLGVGGTVTTPSSAPEFSIDTSFPASSPGLTFPGASETSSSPGLTFAGATETLSNTSPPKSARANSSSVSTKSGTPHSIEPQGLTSSTGVHGLSTGAAIGIGIAISVSVIGLLCALGFFWFRRRSRRKQSEQSAAAQQARGTEAKRARGSIREKFKRSKNESTVASPYELSGKSRAGELETSANRHELDAYRRGERTHELPGDPGESQPQRPW